MSCLNWCHLVLKQQPIWLSPLQKSVRKQGLTNLTLNRRSLLVVIVLLTSNILARADDVTDNDSQRASVLRKIAESAASEYEKIQFLKAEYLVKEVRLVGASAVPINLREACQNSNAYGKGDAVLRMSFDRRRHRLATEAMQVTDPILFSIATGNKVGVDKTRNHHRFLLNEQGFYARDFNTAFGQLPEYPEVKGLKGGRGPIATLEAPHMANKYMSFCFDPSFWFAFDTLLFHEAYRTWANILLTKQPRKSYEGFSEILSTPVKDEQARFVGEEGKEYLYVAEHRTGKYADTRGDVHIITAHAAEVSYLPVFFEFKIGKNVVRTKEWKWKNYEGVFLPEVYSEVIRSAANGEIQWSLSMECKQAEVNGPIGDEFEVSVALGLEGGARLHDKIKGALSVVDEHKKVVSVDNYNASLPYTFESNDTVRDKSAVASTSRRTILFVANFFLLAVLCAIVFYVKRRGKQEG